jgi:hypothetical protein
LKKPKGEEAVLKFLLGAFKEDELKELTKSPFEAGIFKKVIEAVGSSADL